MLKSICAHQNHDFKIGEDLVKVNRNPAGDQAQTNRLVHDLNCEQIKDRGEAS
jgi:hypothetical protein